MFPEKSNKRISLQTIERLCHYRKALEELPREGSESVFWHPLAKMAGVSAAQLRPDLASSGALGNIAKGYPAYNVMLTILRLFGTDRMQNMVRGYV